MRNVKIANFLGVFSFFTMMSKEPPLSAQMCRVADHRRCYWSTEKYIEEVDACLYFYKVVKRTWEKARDFCIENNASLVTLDSLKKAVAVQDYAKSRNLQRFWTGLYYNTIQETFVYSRDGRELVGIMNQMFPKEERRGDCVQAIPAESSWKTLDCTQSINFICAIKSAHLPRRPKISVNRHLNGTKFKAGSSLNVSCEGIVSIKGNLRIVLISSSSSVSEYTAFNQSSVLYKERLTKDKQDGRCKRHASAFISLTTTLHMNGKTLACVSYIDEHVQMCSKFDAYCHVAGTINVYSDKTDKKKPTFFPWERIVLPLMAMFLLPLVIPLRLWGQGGEHKADRHTMDNNESGIYDRRSYSTRSTSSGGAYR